MDYVENIDEEVKKVVQGYETEFLTAYRKHHKNVVEEMNHIKKRTFQAMNDNQHYVDRIETLEKELVIFREESLKFSEKNNNLNQEIQQLRFRIK
jgi:DNA integrity scanning protein DisA with diadenylate cyclase activity